jgi:SOS-response transcriptional repressor LexA
MSHLYEVTGFQSPCAEFAEKPLSLDERYLTNRPSLFIIESGGDSKPLGIIKGDKLLIDRSLSPKEGQLCVCVIQNQFQILKFSSKLLQGQDPETGDFVWGVITTLIREFNRRIED